MADQRPLALEITQLFMAGSSDTKLHDLLKSAARELKATQRELADERDLHEQARKALDTERARVRELQQHVVDAQQALRREQQAAERVADPAIPRERPFATVSERTDSLSADLNVALKMGVQLDDSTNVSRLEPELLEKRLRALDEALNQAEGEAKLHKQRAAALEAQLEATKVDRPDTVQVPPLDASADLQSGTDKSRSDAEARVAVLEAERADAHAKFAALEAELATVRETASLATELDAQLAKTKARTWELEQLKADAEGKLEQLITDAHLAQTRNSELLFRVGQLENELANLRTRRDELNVELGRVENDRKKLVVRVTELESTVQAVRDELDAKRAEAEGHFLKEKEKHQTTAQRLLEARQRTREVETQLADVQAHLANAQVRHAEAVNDARARLEALEAEHVRALAQERSAHEEATTALQAVVSRLETDLAHATTEWHHTNRQYEQLHREMLVLLDQRDEARRQLNALR
jgi:golgin subfamily B member 1